VDRTHAGEEPEEGETHCMSCTTSKETEQSGQQESKGRLDESELGPRDPASIPSSIKPDAVMQISKGGLTVDSEVTASSDHECCDGREDDRNLQATTGEGTNVIRHRGGQRTQAPHDRPHPMQSTSGPSTRRFDTQTVEVTLGACSGRPHDSEAEEGPPSWASSASLTRPTSPPGLPVKRCRQGLTRMSTMSEPRILTETVEVAGCDEK
jgi:hypothetical protein